MIGIRVIPIPEPDRVMASARPRCLSKRRAVTVVQNSSEAKGEMQAIAAQIPHQSQMLDPACESEASSRQ